MPLTSEIGLLLPDSYKRRPNQVIAESIADRLAIWTGSTRFNESHFIREDGTIFQPPLKYFSVRFGLLSYRILSY